MTSNSPAKKVILVIAAAFTAVVMVQYLSLLKPAADREVVAACKGMHPAPENAVFEQFPTPVPSFRAQNPNGDMIDIASYRGKIVLVNFWATWCDVCKSEKPSLVDLHNEMGDDIQILTLASEEDWTGIKSMFKSAPPIPVLLDTPPEGSNLGRVAKSFGITAVPESFLIDRDGNIRYYFINKRNWNSSVARTCLRSLVDDV